jgi:hypothetical protein
MHKSSKWFLHVRLSNKNFVRIYRLHMSANAPPYVILLDLIILTIFEEYKPCSSSLCSFFQLPVTSALSGTNILQYPVLNNAMNLCSFLNAKIPSPTP